MGATPRWMGYVGVDDVGRDAPSGSGVSAARSMCRRPTAISAASPWSPIRKLPRLALVEGLRHGQPELSRHERGQGAIGWHELLAADQAQGICLLRRGCSAGRRPEPIPGSRRINVSAAGGRHDRRHVQQAARWIRFRSGCYYFNVGDIDAAARAGRERRRPGFEGPHRIARRRLDRPMQGPSGRHVRVAGQREARTAPTRRRLRRSAGPPPGAAFHPRAGW